MKLTRDAVAALSSVVANLERAQRYIAEPETFVARACRVDDTLGYLPSNHSARDAGMYATPALRTISKDGGGTPLVFLPTAIRDLTTFIDRHAAGQGSPT